EARRGQHYPAAAAVSRIAVNADKLLRFKGTQQAAGIAGIEAQAASQFLDVGAVRSDLEQEARLAQRPATVEIAFLQRADALGDAPVEAPAVFDLHPVHCLTFARHFPRSKRLVAGEAYCSAR